MQCGNNLKQYGLALYNYHDTYKTFPMGGFGGWAAGEHYKLSWQARVLPFLEQGPLFNQIDWTKINPANHILADGRPLLSAEIPVARCPSDISPRHIDSEGISRFQGSYSGSLGSQSTPSGSGHCNVWQQFMQPLPRNATHGDVNTKAELSGMFSRGLWGRAIPINFADVTDGTSNTIQVGEVLANCQSHRQWGFYHYDGINNAHASTVVPINKYDHLRHGRSQRNHAS